MRRYPPSTIHRYLDLTSTHRIKTPILHRHKPYLQTLVKAPYPFPTYTTATQTQTHVQHSPVLIGKTQIHSYHPLTHPFSTHATPSQTHTHLTQSASHAALTPATECTQDTNIHLHDETLILPIHKHLQLHALQYKQKTQHPSHPLHKHTTYFNTPMIKNTILNNGRHTTNIPTHHHTVITTDIKQACVIYIHLLSLGI